MTRTFDSVGDSAVGDALPCGCAGKTPLDRIVYPACERVRDRLARSGVHLAGRLEAGLVPRTETLERVSGSVSLDEGGVERSWGESVPDEVWAMTAVLTAADAGRSVASFADVLETGYTAPSVPDRVVVAKGHSVQVVGTDRTTVTFDLLHPRGPHRGGYVVGNVDAVHAFPGLGPETQATIAAAHAFNDCYAYGATSERRLRPLVGVPADADSPSTTTVRQWFRQGSSELTDLLDPTVVRHGGRGWLFGASVTAEVDHTPPIHTGRVEPGDELLLHRPLGAVAALAASRDADDPALRDRAVDTLRSDHADVADVVASACPGVGERFDPGTHLKLAVDVSGPGLGGVAETVARSGNRLHVDGVPFVDAEAVRHARRHWLVPDATLGTNGPIAVVGRSAVVERVASRLRERGSNPVRLGHVVSDGGERTARGPRVSTADGVRLDRFVEDTTLHRDGTTDHQLTHDD